MCCMECPLNSQIPADSEKLSVTPEFEKFSKCSNPQCPRNSSDFQDSPQEGGCFDCSHSKHSRLCLHDSFVLRNISHPDSVAPDIAHHSLDTAVKVRDSSFLCELFSSAPFETKKMFWVRLSTCFPEQIDLLEPLFDRYDLPIPDSSHCGVPLAFFLP